MTRIWLNMMVNSFARKMLAVMPLMMLVLFSSCNNEKSRQQTLDERAIEVEKQLDNAVKFNKRKEEELFKREREAYLKRHNVDRVIEWLQGNWEWSGSLDGQYQRCRIGVSDDYAVFAVPSGVLDQGRITVDFDDNTIHFGSSYFDFDIDNNKFGCFKDGMYLRHMSESSSSSTAFSRVSSSRTTTFNTVSDILDYTGSHTFVSNSGVRIRIDYNGMTINGNYVTAAPTVSDFSSQRAVLKMVSPIAGNARLTFVVDAANGRLIDRNDGEVYYMQ